MASTNLPVPSLIVINSTNFLHHIPDNAHLVEVLSSETLGLFLDRIVAEEIQVRNVIATDIAVFSFTFCFVLLWTGLRRYGIVGTLNADVLRGDNGSGGYVVRQSGADVRHIRPPFRLPQPHLLFHLLRRHNGRRRGRRRAE